MKKYDSPEQLNRYYSASLEARAHPYLNKLWANKLYLNFSGYWWDYTEAAPHGGWLGINDFASNVSREDWAWMPPHDDLSSDWDELKKAIAQFRQAYIQALRFVEESEDEDEERRIKKYLYGRLLPQLRLGSSLKVKMQGFLGKDRASWAQGNYSAAEGIGFGKDRNDFDEWVWAAQVLYREWRGRIYRIQAAHLTREIVNAVITGVAPYDELVSKYHQDNPQDLFDLVDLSGESIKDFDDERRDEVKRYLSNRYGVYGGVLNEDDLEDDLDLDLVLHGKVSDWNSDEETEYPNEPFLWGALQELSQVERSAADAVMLIRRGVESSSAWPWPHLDADLELVRRWVEANNLQLTENEKRAIAGQAIRAWPVGTRIDYVSLLASFLLIAGWAVGEITLSQTNLWEWVFVWAGWIGAIGVGVACVRVLASLSTLESQPHRQFHSRTRDAASREWLPFVAGIVLVVIWIMQLSFQWGPLEAALLGGSPVESWRVARAETDVEGAATGMKESPTRIWEYPALKYPALARRNHINGIERSFDFWSRSWDSLRRLDIEVNVFRSKEGAKAMHGYWARANPYADWIVETHERIGTESQLISMPPAYEGDLKSYRLVFSHQKVVVHVEGGDSRIVQNTGRFIAKRIESTPRGILGASSTFPFSRH